MRPFLSIIIPTYNRGNMIGSTIESILNQRDKDFELLIIDDGSTDDTEERVKKYLSGNVFYYRNQHEERNKARNFGTLLAKGQYINWFDSDDIMLPGHVEEIRKIADKEKQPALIGVGYEMIRPGKGVLYRSRFPARVLNPYFLRSNHMLTMTGIVRRDVALAYPFNINTMMQEDYELWLRIAADHTVVGTNTITVQVVEHESNSSEVFARHVPNYIRSIDDLIHEIEKLEGVKKFFNGRMNQFRMYRYIGGAHYLASRGLKMTPMRLLLRSMNCHLLILLRKEFYSTVKHILLTYR